MNNSLYKPPLYKSSGGLFDVATTIQWLLMNTSNIDLSIMALAISVT